MKIIATMKEAAEIIRACEKRNIHSISSCVDCVLNDVCDGADHLHEFFDIVPEVECQHEG